MQSRGDDESFKSVVRMEFMRLQLERDQSRLSELEKEVKMERDLQAELRFGSLARVSGEKGTTFVRLGPASFIQVPKKDLQTVVHGLRDLGASSEIQALKSRMRTNQNELQNAARAFQAEEQRRKEHLLQQSS